MVLILSRMNEMRKYLFIAAAAIAVLSSCTKENDFRKDQPSGGLVFSASIEQTLGTKTALANEGKVNWVSGDEISINGKSYTAAPKTDATLADFTKVSEDAEPVGGKYYAYYPASIYNGGTPTLPAEQVYAESAISNAPMYAVSETESLSFKNICGLLAIKVTSADIAKLKAIRVSSSNHAMSGAFTISDNAAVLATPDDATKTVTLTFSSVVEPASTGTVYYVAVPANTYSNLKIELSPDGSYYSALRVTKDAASVVIARNTIYAVNFTSSRPAGSYGTTDGHSWVQLWKDGPKWAEFNLGATITSYANLATTTSDYTGSGSTIFDLTGNQRGDGNSPTDFSINFCTENVGGLYAERTASANARVTPWPSGIDNEDVDVATTIWGSSWCTPSIVDLRRLGNRKDDNSGSLETPLTSWSWCDGVSIQYTSGCTIPGYKVSGVGDYAGNYTFFPAGGYYYYYSPKYDCIGYYGSRTRLRSSDGHLMVTIKGTSSPVVESASQDDPDFGLAIRPIVKE